MNLHIFCFLYHLPIETFPSLYFFFQAEDGIRDFHVTGVQTCALPISTLKLNLPNKLTQNQISRTNSNFQFLADYNFNITDDHQFVFLGGYQFEDSKYD